MARRRKNGFLSRLSDMLSVLTLLGILAVAAAWFEMRNAETYQGAFRVIDGDSLVLGEQKMRLVGLDAPEFTQECIKDGSRYRCGISSRDFLRSIIRTGGTTCRSEGRDKYDRLLVECFSQGESINERMVAAGWAIAYGSFHGAERAARNERLGIWAGDFDRPDAWRARYGGLIEGQDGAMLQSLWRRIRAWF